MHNWKETHIKDLFLCDCGLYRYPVKRQAKFKKRMQELGLTGMLYVYAYRQYASTKLRVSFRTWAYGHAPCPLVPQ